MSDSSHYSGAITISPPLTFPQFKDCKNLPGAADATLVVEETWIEEGNFRTVTSTASRIIPPEESEGARRLPEFVQALIDRFPDHEFGGHITVDLDPGYGDPRPCRLVVQDRKVVEVQARLVWPGEVDPLVADARAVAGLALDVLRELPCDLDELFGETWEVLPDWFTGENRGSDMWLTDDDAEAADV